MGEDITAGEIGIYLLNRVEVTLKDDSRAEGILQNIAAETITVEKSCFRMWRISGWSGN